MNILKFKNKNSDDKNITNINNSNNEDINNSNNKNSDSCRKKKRVPVWVLVVTDTLITVISLSIFGLFYYVLPQKSSTSGTVVATTEDIDNTSLASSSSSSSSSGNRPSDKSSGKGGTGGAGGENTGNTNTSAIASNVASSTLDLDGKTVTEVNSYSNDNSKITINKVEIGTGNDKVTYYVADVSVTNLKYLQTAFATGSYGKNLKETVDTMAQNNNAILAISGDFYGNSEEGVVIRNGVLYRSNTNDADVCVLFTNGEMKTYSPSEFNADEVISQGAWQAWTFGPQLLDGSGNVLSSFNTTNYLNKENPRCSIGYVSAGNYKFVVVDGRSTGYSRGVTMTELAEIMADEGCKTAYNLDGGKSSAMYFNGEYVNVPADGGREISDIVYIGE